MGDLLYDKLSYRQVEEELELIKKELKYLNKYTILQLEHLRELLTNEEQLNPNMLNLLEKVKKILETQQSELSNYRNDFSIQKEIMGSTSLSSIEEFEEYERKTLEIFDTKVEIFEYAAEKGCLLELLNESSNNRLYVLYNELVKNDITGVRASIMTLLVQELTKRGIPCEKAKSSIKK